MHPDELSETIIGAAMEAHTAFGPGLKDRGRQMNRINSGPSASFASFASDFSEKAVKHVL
jgi:hypothetical protein